MYEATHRYVYAEWKRGVNEPDTFQVKLDDWRRGKLIIDNAEDLDEGIQEEVIAIIEFERELKDKYGITISDCHKEKGWIGFDRYYEMTFCKDGYEIGRTVPFDGQTMMNNGFMQGKKRSIEDVIDRLIDIDELLEEFEEVRNADIEL